MKVSIITPCYNSARWLAFTIESVQSQIYKNWEMIIIDDGSEDDTPLLASHYARSDSRIRFIRLDRNQGVANARNVGLAEAQGRFIAFLDADDVWLPNKLELQIRLMLTNNVGFCYSDYRKINEHGEFISRAIGVPEKVCYADLLNTNYIPCLTAVYDTEQVGKVTVPTFSRRNDYALWLNLLKKLDYAFAVNTVLACYRTRRSGSLSSNKITAAWHHWLVLREQEKLGALRSGYHFTRYAVAGTLKYLK